LRCWGRLIVCLLTSLDTISLPGILSTIVAESLSSLPLVELDLIIFLVKIVIVVNDGSWMPFSFLAVDLLLQLFEILFGLRVLSSKGSHIVQ